MTLDEAIEAFGSGKKIRRADWPPGAYLQLQGAFIDTPQKGENFKAWLNGSQERKVVDYFDGMTLSRLDKANLGALIDVGDRTTSWDSVR